MSFQNGDEIMISHDGSDAIVVTYQDGIWYFANRREDLRDYNYIYYNGQYIPLWDRGRLPWDRGSQTPVNLRTLVIRSGRPTVQGFNTPVQNDRDHSEANTRRRSQRRRRLDMMDLDDDAAAPAAQYTQEQVTEYLGTQEGVLNNMHNQILSLAIRGGVNGTHTQLLMRIISSANRVIDDVQGLLGASNANMSQGRRLYGVGGTNSLRI